MFEKRFLGCLPRLYLRQLYLKMPNNVISKGCIIVSRWNKSCLLPSEWGGVWCRCNGQNLTGRAWGLLNCSLSDGHLAFFASSDVSKGWCVVADERIVSWCRISDRLPTSADRWGWSAINLLRGFVRMQKSSVRLKYSKRSFCVYLIVGTLVIFIQGNAIDLQWSAKEMFLPFWPPLHKGYGGKWWYLSIV